MTINAVTGTFIDATSPRCNARATAEQSTTVIATVMNPKSKSQTAVRAIPAPMEVPTICPNPSRIDLWTEIRVERLATMAATSPPSTINKSPSNHATAAAIAVTII